MHLKRFNLKYKQSLYKSKFLESYFHYEIYRKDEGVENRDDNKQESDME